MVSEMTIAGENQNSDKIEMPQEELQELGRPIFQSIEMNSLSIQPLQKHNAKFSKKVAISEKGESIYEQSIGFKDSQNLLDDQQSMGLQGSPHKKSIKKKTLQEIAGPDAEKLLKLETQDAGQFFENPDEKKQVK